jgi:addiction module HigA family antidote
MMPKTMDPIHPGEILLEEFLEPLQLSQNRLANAIGVPPRRINEMSRYFGTSERFWMNLQSRFDLELERDRIGKDLEQITPHFAS